MDYDKTKYKVWTWKNPMMLYWIISLLLFGIQYSYGQERGNKINTIIDSLRIIETQKWTLKIKIEPLKCEATEEDSLKLIEIENVLTDQEIRKRIIQAFNKVLTDNEINYLYNFTTSSVFHKVFNSSLINNSLINQFKDINSKLDSIARNYEKKMKIFQSLNRYP